MSFEHLPRQKYGCGKLIAYSFLNSTAINWTQLMEDLHSPLLVILLQVMAVLMKNREVVAAPGSCWSQHNCRWRRTIKTKDWAGCCQILSTANLDVDVLTNCCLGVL
ncbi:hypothetical protein BKP30_18585 [Rhodococcus erythropolis]|nr:hypothetical protein BKP30_18585 [Rhodococcus erythropolis]